MRTIEKKAFPEGIQKGNWDISEGLGEVNMVDKIIKIPIGTKEYQKCVRNHEYSHIRFSPLNLGSVRSDKDLTALRAFEDCRVNILCMKSGVDVSKAITPEVVEKLKLQLDNRFLKICSVIAGYEYDVYEELFNSLLEPIDKQIVEQFIKDIKNNANDFEKVKTLSRAFVDMLFPPIPPEPKTSLEELVKAAKEEVQKEVPEIISEDERGLEIEKEKFPEVDWNNVHSGKMTIKTPALTVKNIYRTKTRSDSGMNFRHPERVLTDMQCFEEKKRAPFKGTILIDCSGSMKLVVEKLQDIVKEGCGCTIAGYAGYNRKQGDLIILSEKGNMIQEIPRFPKGNFIDLPAILWLSQQKGNKIWISDGMVADRNECFKVIEKHDITNVATLDDSLALIKQLKRR